MSYTLTDAQYDELRSELKALRKMQGMSILFNPMIDTLEAAVYTEDGATDIKPNPESLPGTILWGGYLFYQYQLFEYEKFGFGSKVKDTALRSSNNVGEIIGIIHEDSYFIYLLEDSYGKWMANEEHLSRIYPEEN